jgi:hypothetical protein
LKSAKTRMLPSSPAAAVPLCSLMILDQHPIRSHGTPVFGAHRLPRLAHCGFSQISTLFRQSVPKF